MSRKNNHFSDIVKVAEELFFKYDYDSVSMNDIVKSLGITKAALYYHFESKQDLFLYIINRDFSFFKEQIEELINSESFKAYRPEEKTEKILIFYFNFIVSKTNFFKILTKRVKKHDKNLLKIFDKMRCDLLETLKPFSQEIINYKKGNKILDDKEVSMLLLSMLNPFVYDFVLAADKKISAETAAKKICFFIFNK